MKSTAPRSSWLLDVRNIFYFLLAYVILSYSLASFVYNRDHLAKLFCLYRANDSDWEQGYLLALAILFALDAVPIALLDVPAKFEILLHHGIIVVIGIWSVVQKRGFPFIIFGGLQEASNLTYMAKVYLKDTLLQRLIAQSVHTVVFFFCRFCLQLTFVVLSFAYFRVPVCWAPLCVALSVAFSGLLVLCARWFWQDVKQLVALFRLHRFPQSTTVNSQHIQQQQQQQQVEEENSPLLSTESAKLERLNERVKQAEAIAARYRAVLFFLLPVLMALFIVIIVVSVNMNATPDHTPNTIPLQCGVQ